MANYIEIKNANGNTIVDDRWNIPKFLYRGKVKGGNIPPTSKMTSYTDGNSFIYREYITFLHVPSIKSLGFGLDYSFDNWAKIVNSIWVFAKATEQKSFRVEFKMHGSEDKGWDLKLYIGSDVPSHEIEFCLYTDLPMVPCKMGAQVFNENGELIFDAMRGYLQVIGTMSEGVNVRNNPAATYRMTLPPELDTNNVFMSFRSTLPFYSAYNIGANGVSYGATFYFPVMRYEGQTIVVDLVQQYNVSGNNGATEYSKFYEHLIYCPYPSGVWITGN